MKILLKYWKVSSRFWWRLNKQNTSKKQTPYHWSQLVIFIFLKSRNVNRKAVDRMVTIWLMVYVKTSWKSQIILNIKMIDSFQTRTASVHNGPCMQISHPLAKTQKNPHCALEDDKSISIWLGEPGKYMIVGCEQHKHWLGPLLPPPLSSLTLKIIMVCIIRVMASYPAADTQTMKGGDWGRWRH